MTIHFSNGIGQLFERNIDMPIAQISYHLSETDATKYTRKKWWGDFHSNKKLKESQLVGTLRVEFDDSRDGECTVWMGNDGGSSKKDNNNLYHFNGRGKLGRGNSGR